MNWQRFQTYGESPQNAFEAFTTLLFERWLRKREEGSPLNVVFVNGAGGDGGVEAYAALSTTEIIGMQAKWFPSTMQKKQFDRIRDSVITALKVRPAITEYVVCVPRNLANKRKKGGGSTEQYRWDSLTAELKKSHPKLELRLWNEARLESLLIEHGSDGLQRYWFDRSSIRQSELQTRYQQARSGWLANRYAPDLHAMGSIESDLGERLAGSDPGAATAEQRHVLAALDGAEREIRRLDLYPSFTETANAQQSAEDALNSIAEARLSLAALQGFLGSNSFSVEVPEDASPTAPLYSLANLLPSPAPMGPDRFERARKAIDNAAESWTHRQFTPNQQRELLEPVVFFAEPGAGKTHAFSSAVERQIDDGAPALLVRAGKYSGSDSMEDVLRDAVGEPAWNQSDILDALEATALLSQAKAASALGPNVRVPRVRVLIAIDGLDESSDAKEWSATVGSVIPLSRRWPRILFAFSARPSLSEGPANHSGLCARHIGESDVPLAPLYFAYTKENQVSCPPSFRWALRSPLAIRLFAEVYRGKTVRAEWFELSVASLLDKKLEHVEVNVRAKHRGSLRPVRRILLAIARACIHEGRPLNDDEALDRADASISPRGAIPRNELHALLEALAEYGLLLRTRVASPGLDPDNYQWEPAFETLSDYLLAVEAQSTLAITPPPARAPNYLRKRRDALALAITISGTKGFTALESGLWQDDIGDAKALLQLRALLASPPEEAQPHSDWVKTQLTHDMPSCRLTLAALVIPGLRLAGFKFGAAFVQEALQGLGVAARDLFWSGPSFLPHNHGAVWEGRGSAAIDRLELADDDAWNTAPLLLAWTLTTVEQKLRRKRRRQLANWGALHLKPLKWLLAEASLTNDPQMLEDILRAAQAACFLANNLDEGAKTLGEWVLRELPARINECSPDNIVCLHASRSIVETLRCRGIELDEPEVAYSDREFLDLDVSILPSDRLVHSGTKIISGDLAHYAVPGAYRPFFPSRPFTPDEAPEQPEESLTVMKAEMLSALATGKIRRGAREAERKAAAQELARRAEAMRQAEEERREREEKILPLVEEFHRLPEEEQQRILESWRPEPEIKHPTELYPDAAVELLDRHVKRNSLDSLRASEFAFAHISWRAKQFGWNSATHYGDPRGEEPGEVLGADIAILRRHYPAKHGRTDVSMFSEKYVWIGMHELVGFLSANLAAKTWDTMSGPPADPSLFIEEPSPATDELNPVATSGVDDEPFSVLVPDVALSSKLQFEKANEWIEAAPPQGFQTVFSFAHPTRKKIGSFSAVAESARTRIHLRNQSCGLPLPKLPLRT